MFYTTILNALWDGHKVPGRQFVAVTFSDILSHNANPKFIHTGEDRKKVFFCSFKHKNQSI